MMVQIALHIIFFLLLISKLPMVVLQRIAMPNCVNHCRNVSIPYPFGMGSKNCYLNEWYAVDCKLTNNYLTPFLRKMKSEIIEISVDYGTVLVQSPIISSNCFGFLGQTGELLNLKGSPFYFSSKNRFTAMGCNSIAYIKDSQHNLAFIGCWLVCNDARKYCQDLVPSSYQEFDVVIERGNYTIKGDQQQCQLAFLVEESWFENNLKKSSRELETISHVPMLLDWMFNDDYAKDKETTYQCEHLKHSSHHPERKLCKCKKGYHGNPYLPDGCEDVNECKSPGHNCKWATTCQNTPGNFDCKLSISSIIISGTIVVILALFALIIGGRWLHEAFQKKKNIKRRKEFFTRALRQHLHVNQDNFEKAVIFNLQDLEKATDHFNVSRILGQGGQSVVYKGMLRDGRIVAVKKTNTVNGLEEFINEVAILLQINHRNVVKLHGCCLHTKVPLLVYEYVSHGTLSQHLHQQNTDSLLSWDMRIQIAIEISEALSYLHYAAPVPIYHRDIKSTNILLDENYTAKISDFGISRSIDIGQTHLTTNVHGTFGYLDPEYFSSGHFTEKSDVFSFGVVLVELLTGKKSIISLDSQEVISLATFFDQSMEREELFDIIDHQIREHYVKEEALRVANLAKRCLDQSGHRRPTMIVVARELEGIRLSREYMSVQEHNEEIESSFVDNVSTT